MERENLLALAESMIAKAKNRGADMSEIYISHNQELMLEVRNGIVDTMKLAQETGLGLRIMREGKVGFAFTSDMVSEALDGALDQALANAAVTAPDPHRMLPLPGATYPDCTQYDEDIQRVSVEEKIELARKMEQEAKSYDSRIKVIEGATYTDTEEELLLVNSRGVKLTNRGSYFGISIALVAGEEADSQSGFALDYTVCYQNLRPAAVGQEAARRAVRMLGAKPMTGAKVPVILEPYVVTGFLGLLIPGLSAESVQKGRSLFAGKLGQTVASPLLQVVDDGSLPKGLASVPFDGEGVPTSRTVLIDKGELKQFLYNTYTASKDGVVSTGNGVRHSFKSTPEVGATNFFIEPGQVSPEDMVQGIEKGLYVTEVLGMHTANPISGDFSLGAAGLWIDKGKVVTPVRGIAIAGNIIELLKNVEAVGSDLTFFGGKGAPSIMIQEMHVSGH